MFFVIYGLKRPFLEMKCKDNFFRPNDKKLSKQPKHDPKKLKQNCKLVTIYLFRIIINSHIFDAQCNTK